MSKFGWARFIRDQPASSPLWVHDDRCGPGCRRKDGGRLSPVTLKNICRALLDYAQAEDGGRVFPGIGRPEHEAAGCERLECDHQATGLVLATCLHRSTIIAALGHLELVGLIRLEARAGAPGMPRHYANRYSLTCPGAEELDALGVRPPAAGRPAAVPAPRDPASEPYREPPPPATAPGEPGAPLGRHRRAAPKAASYQDVPAPLAAAGLAQLAAEELAQLGGRPVSLHAGVEAVRLVLGGRTPRDPAAYLRHALRADPGRFMPAPGPDLICQVHRVNYPPGGECRSCAADRKAGGPGPPVFLPASPGVLKREHG